MNVGVKLPVVGVNFRESWRRETPRCEILGKLTLTFDLEDDLGDDFGVLLSSD